MIPSTCDIVPMHLMTLLTQTFQAIAHEALQVFLLGYPTEHGGKSRKNHMIPKKILRLIYATEFPRCAPVLGQGGKNAAPFKMVHCKSLVA